MASAKHREPAAAWTRRKSVAAQFGAALLVVACVRPADAEPRIEITERFYDVEGPSVGSLRAQMADRGPYSEKAEGHVPARTEATVEFKFSSRRSGSECRAARIRVTADITYIYPNWIGLDGASVRLGDKWVDYVDRLRVHEEGHGRMVMDAAHEVEEALQSTSPSRDCQKLRQRARARGEEILRSMAEAQIQYDADTEGGQTQGAVFSAGTDVEPRIN